MRISSLGPSWPSLLGDYSRVEGGGLVSGRPVWQIEGSKRFVFYSGHNGLKWLVGPNYTSHDGWIRSEDTAAETVPMRGWRYVKGGREDTSLVVSGQ